MNSALTPVRNAFKAAISGLGYAVYDRQRKVNDYPYIVIGEQTEIQEGDQGEFGQIATINIEVYNGWNSDYGERTTSDTIVNAITGLITKPYSIVIAGFASPVQSVDNIMTQTEQTQTHTIVTTVIRFKLQLFQNTNNAPTPETVELLLAETTSETTINLYFSTAMNNPAAFIADFKVQMDNLADPNSDELELEISEVEALNASTYRITILPYVMPDLSSVSMTAQNTVTVTITAGNIKSVTGIFLETVTDFAVTNNL